MRDTNGRIESMLRKLQDLGFRITHQLRAIVKILAESKGHPYADEIHASVKAEFPTTAIVTVYNTSAVLKTVGEVLELEFTINERSRHYE